LKLAIPEKKTYNRDRENGVSSITPDIHLAEGGSNERSKG
jgi:hypothetical protein